MTLLDLRTAMVQIRSTCTYQFRDRDDDPEIQVQVSQSSRDADEIDAVFRIPTENSLTKEKTNNNATCLLHTRISQYGSLCHNLSSSLSNGRGCFRSRIVRLPVGEITVVAFEPSNFGNLALDRGEHVVRRRLGLVVLPGALKEVEGQHGYHRRLIVAVRARHARHALALRSRVRRRNALLVQCARDPCLQNESREKVVVHGDEACLGDVDVVERRR